MAITYLSKDKFPIDQQKQAKKEYAHERSRIYREFLKNHPLTAEQIAGAEANRHRDISEKQMETALKNGKGNVWVLEDVVTYTMCKKLADVIVKAGKEGRFSVESTFGNFYGNGTAIATVGIEGDSLPTTFEVEFLKPIRMLKVGSTNDASKMRKAMERDGAPKEQIDFIAGGEAVTSDIFRIRRGGTPEIVERSRAWIKYENTNYIMARDIDSVVKQYKNTGLYLFRFENHPVEKLAEAFDRLLADVAKLVASV